MNREQALSLVKEHLTPKRYIHSIGVANTAMHLANIYGADVKKAELAGILHDYAKFRDIDEMRRIVVEQQMDSNLLEHHSELLHAPVGAFLVKEELGVMDEDILRAIRYHTSGCTSMSLLDKIIYLADYIEPNRDFPGVNEVRELAEKDLDEAIIQSIRNSIQHLLNRQQRIYPDTIHFYNELMRQKENE